MMQDDEETLVCQIKSLLAKYESAGQASTREVDFLQACVRMMQTSGRVTPNMERWLNSLLAAGGPSAPTDESLALAAKLQDLLTEAGVHTEFLEGTIARVQSGKPISARYRAAVDKVVLWIEGSREKGALTADELRALSMSKRILDGYAMHYRMERSSSFNTAYGICKKFEMGEEINRAEWQTLVSVAARVREAAYPKFEVGDLAYCSGRPVLILSPIDVDNFGNIVYNILDDGMSVKFRAADLRSRTPRGKSKQGADSAGC